MLKSKNEMIRRAAEMIEARDYSGLESMAEILLKSANMQQVSAPEVKDMLDDYEDSFEIDKLAAAINVLIDVAA